MIKLDTDLVPSTFYVAVSSGIDSIAAVHLLQMLNDKSRIRIFHYNHNLRPQNDLMEQAVRKYANDFKIPITVIKREKKTDNTEDALHKDRQDAYKSLNSDVIVCHHLDDAVESYIMNMLKGSPEHIPIATKTYFLNDSKCAIYRPFLKTEKEDLRMFVKNYEYLNNYVVEDETNKDNTYRRNYIRNEVVPKFKGMGLPKVVLKKFYL